MKGNSLRTVLTVVVIVFGIMALVGMITAVNGLKSSLLQNFSQMGSNAFTITDEVMFSNRSGEEKEAPKITFRQAMRFRDKYQNPFATVSVSYTAMNSAIVKFKSKKTTPKIMVVGADENYFATSSLQVEKGRAFNDFEVGNGSHVAIIGIKLKQDLFKDENPIGKILTVGSNKYKVIGVLKEKGSSFGFSFDNIVILPLLTARKTIVGRTPSYKITVDIARIEQLDPAYEQALAVFRIIRKLRPGDSNNFEIERSDSLVGMVTQNLSAITIITLVVSIVTLISSAVSLMNIMLVSVKERITEIGTLKALGARISDIRSQFLAEAVLLSQIGGLGGIVAGLVMGNLISHQMGSSFVVPWSWIIIAYLSSVVVGALAGYYPASRAARLDPIEALRYE